ncbi:MAG: flagellar biosynthesis protein FlhF [Deltaproteobacteria bacterium]|nr:flagellar biosynthesis protein FlhF [Deltaproteobacteria bacterium]
MQIKKFRAQDMAEALRLVKKEFGSQAVILSAKDIKNGLGMLGFLKGPCVEVTAATDASYPADRDNKVPAGRWRPHKGVSVGPVSVGQRDWRRPISLVREDSGNFRNRANPARAENRIPQQRDIGMGLFDLSQEMQNQGVKEKIALDLIKKLDAAVSPSKLFELEEIKPQLLENLAKMGAATRSVRVERGKQKVIALIGPTGVGKTTTIAKLAAIEGLTEKRVGLITLDDKRIGAMAQLEIYARVLDVQMEIALTKEELENSLKKLKKKDLILIDTPGISQKDTRRLGELKDLLDHVRSVEIHLLLSAGTKEKDFIRMLDRFGVMSIDSLIFTKLDDSSEYGDLLNQLIRTKIPVSYFTNSPQVPEGIEIATLEKLVDMIWVRKKGTGRFPRRSEKSRHREEVQREYGPYLKRSYA